MGTTMTFLFGAVLGSVMAWLWSASHVRAETTAEMVTLRATIGGRDSTITELRLQIAEQGTTLTQLRTDLDAARESRAIADTRLEESLRSVEQQTELLATAEQRLKDTFTALSADALKNNSAMFVTQAEERIQPLREVLARYEKQVQELEAARANAYGSVTTELRSIKDAHTQLQKQTSNLVTALRAPQVKGRWGEITLHRVVEIAGMSPHCDFVEQRSMETENGKLRPDLIVTLPGNRTVVVDSKAPLAAYLEAVDAPDENARRDCLLRHARAVRTHMGNLAGKAYWSQFTNTPDFVVLFLPGESFFSAALEQDRTLIEDGIEQRVILATPTTLIALLRTVAFSWQQQQVAQNAQRIAEAGKELFERVCKFAEHLSKVGDGLRKATDTYNAAVASWTNRILPSGRRMTELGVSSGDHEVPELGSVEVAPRALPVLDS